MRTATIFVFFIATIAICMKVPAMEKNSNYSIDVRVLDSNPGGALFGVNITNLSGKDIRIYNRDLPWGENGNFVKSVVINDVVPENVQLQYPIRDFFEDYVLLQNDSTLSGEVNLSWLLHEGVPGLLEKRELIVFWLFDLKLTDETHLGELNGAVRIPR